MGALLTALASPRVLDEAWQAFRTDRGNWRRGVTMAEACRNLVRHMGELAQNLHAGRYRPDPPKHFTVTKADGGKRSISAYAVRDKVAQRACLLVVEPLGEAVFHRASYGYRRICTREMAVARLREHVRDGWTWVGDADIRACFDEIPHSAVLSRFHALCRDRAVTDLVRLWLEAGQVGHRGLPQGMVLSPFLCNLYLTSLDRGLATFRLPFVRYADDFVVLGRSEAEARRGLDVAARELGRLGLALNPAKTRVLRSSRKVRFLGLRLPEIWQ